MLYLHKVIICYIGIILITSALYIYTKHNLFRNILHSPFHSPFHSPLQEGASGIGGEIEKALSKPFKPVTNFIENVIKDIANMKKRGADFQTAFKTLGKAFDQEWNAIVGGAALAGNDIAGAATTSSNFLNEFFIKYMGPLVKCGWQKITDIKYCFFYYAIELVCETIYTIMVRTPVFIISLFTGYDINPTIDMVWDVIYYIDDICYEFMGLHVIKWSDEIMDRCFLCNVPPMPDPSKVANAFNKMGHDNTVVIPAMFNQANSSFTQFGNQLSSAVLGTTSDVKSVSNKIGNKVASGATATANTIASGATATANTIASGTTTTANTIASGTTTTANTVASGTTATANTVASGTTATANTVASGATSTSKKAASGVTSTAKKAASIFK